jgi:hypothetical protein
VNQDEGPKAETFVCPTLYAAFDLNFERLLLDADETRRQAVEALR